MVPSTINTININEIVLTIFKGLHEHYFENDYNNVIYTKIIIISQGPNPIKPPI